MCEITYKKEYFRAAKLFTINIIKNNLIHTNKEVFMVKLHKLRKKGAHSVQTVD